MEVRSLFVCEFLFVQSVPILQEGKEKDIQDMLKNTGGVEVNFALLFSSNSVIILPLYIDYIEHYYIRHLQRC